MNQQTSTIKLITEHMNEKRQDLGDIQRLSLNATNEKNEDWSE